MNNTIYVAKITTDIQTELEVSYGDEWIIDFVEVLGDIFIHEDDAKEMLQVGDYVIVEFDTALEIGAPQPRVRKH